MLVPAHFLLLLLLLLGSPGMGLSYKFSKAESIFCCIKTALSEAEKSQLEDAPLLSKRGFPYLPSQDPFSGENKGREEEEEGKKKRTFSGPGGGSGAGNTPYKYLSQAQFKGRMNQEKDKGDRRTRLTLSLDVPTNIMNILFNIAKAKNLRAKAAANAHLMAQIGRKK
ncbi:urocortin-3 [Pteronotus mesoamericanus]|uniref:urocortin-3 n=1 Tax=Pteronotus mesoamericanus TaxID=1884717 RepID=UPI0023EABDB7|nr:urocortin-3 [Pteronotus parnellii mesoamericanus]